MAKRVLITGGLGFIGHHFIEHVLKNTDWDVVSLDRLDTSGNPNRLTDIDIWEKEKHRVKVWYWDLRAEINVGMAQMLLEYNKNGSYRPFDYIVHMAAGSHVDRSISDPLGFVQDNVVGTANLLEFIRLFPALTDEGKFLYFSTDEVFGPAPEGVLFKEWDRHNPNNPYAATKSGAEDLAVAFAHTYKIPTIVTHCMNVFGERQLPEKFIPMCIKKVFNDESISIHSNKEKTKAGTRFYLHTRNICDAVVFLLKNGDCLDGSGKKGKYNIVGDQEVSNLEMAMLVHKYVQEWQNEHGIPTTPLKYEMVDFHSSRPGHDLRYGLDGSLMREIGWKAPVDFEKSLERTIKWTIEHKDKWL